MVKYVYSAKYRLDWPGHVFPVEKYDLIRARLGEVLEPEPATREQLLLAHTPGYLDYLEWVSRSPERGGAAFEAPCSPRVLEAFRCATGGTLLAGRLALREGAAANVGGGFHHASAGRGEGFCLINDIAVAIRVLQKEGLVRQAAVVDLDLHQGNGTALIFQGDPSVFTCSIHQEHLYPPKERSSLDVGLESCTGDGEYLEKLRASLPRVFESRPELVIYQAGADPYEEDQLGSLRLTMEGLRGRDRFVFEECRRRGVPVAVTLGGGYARRTEDVVTIHLNTLRLLEEVFSGASAPRPPAP
jgi:acetoin utilization deacetylase AcuC-like enzyme